MARIVTDKQLDEFLEFAQQVVDADYMEFAKNFDHPEIPVLSFSKVTGKTKYARIVSNNRSQSSSWAFVRLEDGDVLKAASFKAPALNYARGNIYDDAHGLASARWTSVQ